MPRTSETERYVKPGDIATIRRGYAQLGVRINVGAASIIYNATPSDIMFVIGVEDYTRVNPAYALVLTPDGNVGWIASELLREIK